MADRDYGMDRGAVRAHSNFDFAAELPHAGSDAADANSRRSLPLRHAVHAVAIVGDYEMQPTGDPSQVDGDVRCGGMAMDVGQRLLNYAKERPLQSERQLVDLRARPGA